MSDRSGYGTLRELIRQPEGFNALTRREISTARSAVADQYGLRVLLEVDGKPIKFEIRTEGRIEFETPGTGDSICGVATLSTLDAAAGKLLANSDRWADRSAYSRDIIDLAMLEPAAPLLAQAIAKAQTAYRTAIVNELHKAVDDLRENPLRLDECMRALQMHDTPKALLWDRIKKLVR